MESRIRTLVVEEDAATREFIAQALAGQGYEVDQAPGGASALQKIKTRDYDLVVADLRNDGAAGLALLNAARQSERGPEVIVLASGETALASETVRLYAADLLVPPLEEARLLFSVRRALERHGLRSEVTRLRRVISDRIENQTLVAAGVSMRQVAETIESVAHTDAPVLIQGESGTGKELVARAIHSDSRRADGPFITVNAALPEAVLLPELFGPASSTGGRLRQAQGGTLFLQDVDRLPETIQTRLLRFLETQTAARAPARAAGASRGGAGPASFLAGPPASREQAEAPAGVRLICGTQRDLGVLVESGAFRRDLYYNLRIVPLVIPPLRDRREDIIALAEHFLLQARKQSGKDVRGLTEPAIRRLLEYRWPGNVRELENVITGAVALCRESHIDVEALEPFLRELPGEEPGRTGRHGEEVPLGDLLEQVERRHIETVLENHGWNQLKAAEALGIGRTTLWRKLERYGLRRRDRGG